MKRYCAEVGIPPHLAHAQTQAYSYPFIDRERRY
jgi:hypothetical protein